MSNKLLKAVVMVGLFAIPFVPLIITKSLFFPFITGKAFVFRLIVEIIFAAWIILAIRDSEYRLKFSWISGALLLFLVTIGVANVFSENPFKSFWSNYERMEGFLGLLHFVGYFVVAGTVLKDQKIWDKLFMTNLLASAVVAIYSFFQLAGKIAINQGGVRVDGTFGNAGYLGIYMVFQIFIAALLLLRQRPSYQKYLIGLVGLMNLSVLYFTATRGAIIGFGFGVFVTLLILIARAERGTKIKKWGIGAIATGVFLIGIFVAIRNTSFVQNSPVLTRFANSSLSEIKTQGRYFVWPMAINGFVERPVFGWGQESFNYVFNKYYDPRMYNQEPWFDRTHNTILDWAIAGGALGALSYLSIWGALGYYLFSKKNQLFEDKREQALIFGLLSAYFLNNIFVFDQIGSYIMFMLVLAYVHHATDTGSVGIWRKLSLSIRKTFDSESKRSIAESVVVLLFVAALYFFNFLPWQQNKQIMAALQANASSDLSAPEVFGAPLKDYSMGFPEALEHTSQVAIALSMNQSVPADLKLELFESIDKAFLAQLEKVPNDARYRLFYGIFLSRYGWYGRAVEQLNIARELSPKKQGILFELSSNLLLDGKVKESAAVAKEAYMLEPNYKEARIIYGLTSLAAGDTIASKEAFEGISESELIFDDRYMTVLLSLQRYSEIVSVAKRRIALDPSNINHYITLTAAYLQAGDRAGAVRTLREVISLDPSFKERGEYYINEIQAGRNP